MPYTQNCLYITQLHQGLLPVAFIKYARPSTMFYWVLRAMLIATVKKFSHTISTRQNKTKQKNFSCHVSNSIIQKILGEVYRTPLCACSGRQAGKIASGSWVVLSCCSQHCHDQQLMVGSGIPLCRDMSGGQCPYKNCSHLAPLSIATHQDTLIGGLP